MFELLGSRITIPDHMSAHFVEDYFHDVSGILIIVCAVTVVSNVFETGVTVDGSMKPWVN